MTTDRRNDMGQKILIGLILGGFGTIVGFFINSMSEASMAGIKIGHDNSIKIAYLESSMSSISSDLGEIKILLRRRVIPE